LNRLKIKYASALQIAVLLNYNYCIPISTKRKKKFGKTSDMEGFVFIVSVTGFHRGNAKKAVDGDNDEDQDGDDSDTSI
jgi:hypothetical protein